MDKTAKASTPVARGLPRSWDEIAPGHLVIAQESLVNGWWEAIVLDRKDDLLTLRFRDYPRLPKFKPLEGSDGWGCRLRHTPRGRQCVTGP